MKRFSIPLAAGVFIATCFPTAASACSDLPNICEQQAAHFREQLDIAATPPYRDDEEYYDDASGGDRGDAFPRLSPEEWNAFLAEQQDRIARDRAEAVATHEKRMRDDPKYRLFMTGEWIPADEGALAKGGSCTLHFTRQGSGAMIIGPTADYKGAFLALYGPGAPTPKRTDKLRVRLTQTDTPPATVNVFSATSPWSPELGIVYFAVPTLDAALEGMIDTLRFEVSSADGSRPMIDVEWTGGLEARDAMRACEAQRQRVAAK